MTTPNTIIAGMPKCGTTSLFHYLADHPQVCASKVKETYYLMDKASPLFNPGANLNIHGENGYSVFFPNFKNEPIVLESTPDYFYQSTAFDYLAQKNPKPVLIFILREPTARIYSLFRFAQNNMSILPRQMRFAQFLENVRKGAFAQRPILANALEHSRYYKYLTKWAKTMGKEKIYILSLEALQMSPVETMKSTASFIGIDTGFYTDYRFKKQNQSITVRWPLLQRFKRQLSKSTRTGKWRSQMDGLYRRINIQAKRPEANDEDKHVREELRLEFLAENKQLMEFGLDASNLWNKGYRYGDQHGQGAVK